MRSPLGRRLLTLIERIGGHTKGVSELERDDGARPNAPPEDATELDFNDAISEAWDAPKDLRRYAATHEQAPIPDGAGCMDTARKLKDRRGRRGSKQPRLRRASARRGNGIELLRMRREHAAQSGRM